MKMPVSIGLQARSLTPHPEARFFSLKTDQLRTIIAHHRSLIAQKHRLTSAPGVSEA